MAGAQDRLVQDAREVHQHVHEQNDRLGFVLLVVIEALLLQQVDLDVGGDDIHEPDHVLGGVDALIGPVKLVTHL